MSNDGVNGAGSNPINGTTTPVNGEDPAPPSQPQSPMIKTSSQQPLVPILMAPHVCKRQSQLRTTRKSSTKGFKWDEDNIEKTYHPQDKDYGFMKIDEPKTPYNYDTSDPLPEGAAVNPKELVKHLESVQAGTSSPEPKGAHQAIFEAKRKKHYNEGLMLKQMRERLKKEEEEEEENELKKSDQQQP